MDRQSPASAAVAIVDRLRPWLPQRIQGIRRATPIAALELDSLDLIELLCAVEAEFHVSLTFEEFESVSTAGELADLIHRKTNSTVEPLCSTRIT